MSDASTIRTAFAIACVTDFGGFAQGLPAVAQDEAYPVAVELPVRLLTPIRALEETMIKQYGN
jgi:hypothetical protein